MTKMLFVAVALVGVSLSTGAFLGAGAAGATSPEILQFVAGGTPAGLWLPPP